MKKTIKVLTYNIHKGFSFGNRAFVLDKIREGIRLVGADLVFLQELQGYHVLHSKKVNK
jgi:endonuclease/exonuclease/phosphatase family metal-dependent hydrolase